MTTSWDTSADSGCITEADQVALAMADLAGTSPISVSEYLGRITGGKFAASVRAIISGETEQIPEPTDDPDTRIIQIRAKLDEHQRERNQQSQTVSQFVVSQKAAFKDSERARQRQERRLRRELSIANERKRLKEDRGVERTDEHVRRVRINAVSSVAIATVVIVFVVWAMSRTGSSGTAGSSLIVAPKGPAIVPGVLSDAGASAPAEAKPAPAPSIPPGFMQASRVGVLAAIERDSYVPKGAPAQVAIWRHQIEQVSADPRIIAAGNYNIFASGGAAGNAGFGSQAYLYEAILTRSGGNPHYYLKTANGVVLEGLVPLTLTKGKLIAAEMGITFNPYGACDPKATVQPVTCGPYNSLLVAARYINDIASVMSSRGRYSVYKAQADKGLAGAGGSFLPIYKLSDVTCVWHPELRDAKTKNMQCDMSAAMAFAWRNNVLIGSPLYREMLASKGYAQLLAQAKAELVRERWLV